MHQKFKYLPLAALILSSLFSTANANTVTVSGTILYDAVRDGTTFDRWNINMLNAGNFNVNVLAFESTSNEAVDASDINGDGEFTYLDPDTYFYTNTHSPLLAADLLARCDDIENNCNTIDTPTIKLHSLSQIEGAEDGSIHHRRDPAFNVTLAAGDYLYLMADYRLSTSDAEDGFDFGNDFKIDSDHADYQITFSSNTMNFDVSGNTINVSAVPVPAAVWLFGTSILGLFARKKLVS